MEYEYWRKNNYYRKKSHHLEWLQKAIQDENPTLAPGKVSKKAKRVHRGIENFDRAWSRSQSKWHSKAILSEADRRIKASPRLDV